MGYSKEEWSGGTVDWPPKIQTTNLVGTFVWDNHERDFQFMQWKFSQSYLLNYISQIASLQFLHFILSLAVETMHKLSIYQFLIFGEKQFIDCKTFVRCEYS